MKASEELRARWEKFYLFEEEELEQFVEDALAALERAEDFIENCRMLDMSPQETEDMARQIQKSREEIARGETVSHEDLWREIEGQAPRAEEGA